MTQDRPTKTVFSRDALLSSTTHTQVWKARREGRRVALKTARDEAGQASIRLEAAALQRIRHPHVVRYLGHDPYGRWLATEFIDGDRFDRWSASQPVRDVVRVVEELLSGVRALHNAGCTHGDISPANVILDDLGHPKLLDLGESTRIGEVGSKRVTPGFAAPECLTGEARTAATDLYGLGGLLHVALTGQPPVPGRGEANLTHLATSSLPLPPSAWRIDVGARLDRVIERLLARRPGARPGADQLARALSEADADAPGQPILGMFEARLRIRQTLVEAADQGARVIVLYGPAGSGRRTLAVDARRAARSEGFRYLHEATAADFLASAKKDRHPPLTIWTATSQRRLEATERFLRSARQGVIVLYGTRPVPSLHALGAVHITPVPLERAFARQLGEALGVRRRSIAEAWNASHGHPGLLRAELEARSPRRRKSKRDALTEKVAHAIRTEHADLDAVSKRLNLPRHEILDHIDLIDIQG